MFNNYEISNSQLSPIFIANYHTSSRASCGWRFRIISTRAALASVDKHVSSATNFLGSLRVEVETAGTVSCIMHFVLAETQLISWSRHRTSIFGALFIRVVIAFSLSWISFCIYCRLSWTSDESATSLIVCVCHRRSIAESSATVEVTSRSFSFCFNRNAMGNSQKNENDGCVCWVCHINFML